MRTSNFQFNTGYRVSSCRCIKIGGSLISTPARAIYFIFFVSNRKQHEYLQSKYLKDIALAVVEIEEPPISIHRHDSPCFLRERVEFAKIWIRKKYSLEVPNGRIESPKTYSERERYFQNLNLWSLTQKSIINLCATKRSTCWSSIFN